jgi:2-iminobutanoate/2-iminopropanoate deaminase
MEKEFGYSRAVSVGDTLYTSATASVDEQLNVVGADAYQQALAIFEKLRPIFSNAGYSFADVVHVRMYVADIGDMNDVARAFKQTFGSARPAMSILHVGPYSLPELRLEAELIAVRTGTGA